MPTIPIKWIKDKEDGRFFPFTHEDAVIDENGNTISEKYAELVETKQDVISDLEDIRAGAALGATSLQTIPTYTLDEISDGSTRKLANYLPLTGGTMTGAITMPSGSSATDSSKGINFANGSTVFAHVGESTLLGLYSNGKIVLRPNGATSSTTGNGSIEITNSGITIYEKLTAESIVKSGGTSSQFLKADGSVDGTSYAPLASPALTGTPTAPTATAGTNTTQIATTAFVKTAVDNKVHYVANLQSGTAVNYITEPEVKSVKINGSTTNSASSNNCVLQYDTTNKCLKFVFN